MLTGAGKKLIVFFSMEKARECGVNVWMCECFFLAVTGLDSTMLGNSYIPETAIQFLIFLFCSQFVLCYVVSLRLPMVIDFECWAPCYVWGCGNYVNA